METGEPLASATTYTENAELTGSFNTSVKRNGLPTAYLGWIQALLLPGERVALCTDTSDPSELSLVFPFLTGSEFHAVRRHGNRLILDSLLVTLTLESDNNLKEQAAIEVSQWSRVFSRLISKETAGPNKSQPAMFKGLGILLPSMPDISDPSSQRFIGRSSSRPQDLGVKTTMPTSRTMRRISLGLQKPIETCNMGFGDDLKSLLADLDKPKSFDKLDELDEQREDKNMSTEKNTALEMPFSHASNSEAPNGSDLTPSPTRLYLDVETPTPPRRMSRADCILQKEADIMRSRDPSLSNLASMRERGSDTQRQPPNIPPPVLRSTNSSSSLQVVDLNDSESPALATPEISSLEREVENDGVTATEIFDFDLDHPGESQVLKPVSQNIARPKKNTKLLKTVKRMLSKRGKESETLSPKFRSAASDSPNVWKSSSSPVLTTEAMKPTVIAVANSNPINRIQTCAVPTLKSDNSISALSFRSMSSRSLPLEDCISEPETEDEGLATRDNSEEPATVQKKESVEDIWNETLSSSTSGQESSGSIESSPVLLRREKCFSPVKDVSPVAKVEIEPVTALPAPSTLLNGYPANNRSMPTLTSNDSIAESKFSSSSVHDMLSVSNCSGTHSTTSSYSSISSRRSAYSSASSLASLSAPSLTLQTKPIIQEVTLYASKLWVSVWQNNHWIPLSQDLLATEIVTSPQGAHISITVKPQNNLTLAVSPTTEIRRISIHDVEVKTAEGVYMFRGREVENVQRFFKTLWEFFNNVPSNMFSLAEKSNARKSMVPPLMSRGNATMKYPLTSTIIEE